MKAEVGLTAASNGSRVPLPRKGQFQLSAATTTTTTSPGKPTTFAPPLQGGAVCGAHRIMQGSTASQPAVVGARPWQPTSSFVLCPTPTSPSPPYCLLCPPCLPQPPALTCSKSPALCPHHTGPPPPAPRPPSPHPHRMASLSVSARLRPTNSRCPVSRSSRSCRDRSAAASAAARA